MIVYKRDGKTYGYYEPKTKTLMKINLTKKHLVYKYGGVPSLDKTMYDSIKDKLKWIECKTKDGKVFKIKACDFEERKIEIDYGFGKQVTTEIENWVRI